MPGGEEGDPRRIRDYSLVLRQVLLHRAIGTFAGAVLAFREKLIYSMVLSIRGNYETTAALGYLYQRLDSLGKGHISKERVDEDLCAMLLGRRDNVQPMAPEAKQVLSLLEQADEAVSKDLLGGTSKQHKILSANYNFLCEFCHPNFYSSTLAYRLQEQSNECVMRYNGEILEEEAKLFDYLLISSPLFIELYDRIESLIPPLPPHANIE